MAYEATLYQAEPGVQDYTPETALTGGKVIAMADGRCGVLPVDVASGALGAVRCEGIFTLQKTTGIVFLDGGRVYWDASASKTYFRTVNDKDFYVGVAVGDAASSDTTMKVNINVNPYYVLDGLNGPSLSVATGTIAAGGFDIPKSYGGAKGLQLTNTNEAQCVDILTVDRVDVAANPIFEAQVRLGANGSSNAVDISFGLVNGTSTTDADAITNHVLFHMDGGDLSLFVQSKDGTTTVAATDTTLDVTAGSATANRFELWIDARDITNVKCYVDGVRVLPGTTFVLTAATGPLGILAHVEKTSSVATAGPIYIDRLQARIAQK